MSKDCQSCVKEGIGCESVQKMMREIDELKKAKAHRILMLSVFTVVLAFLTICFIIWHHMLRQPIMLQQMPESQLKDLSELFNAQFSNLLTVLCILITIFGFILPLINLYYQRQTLKEERESIKREVDRNLEIIKEQVKNFDFSLQQAKKERKAEIANVRDNLEKTINDARKDFQKRQDNVDKKLAEHEAGRNWDNGYFMQQLAIADTNPEGKVIYYSNALPYFSQCSNNKDVQWRIDNILKNLLENINKIPKDHLQDKEYSGNILQKIEKAKKDLIYNYHFCSQIDKIIELIKKPQVDESH